MKRLTVVFPRRTFVTPDGSKTVYTHDADLDPVLGQAKIIRVHVHGHRKSSSAKITLQAYESGLPGERPSQVGKTLGGAIVITDLRPAFADITGNFGGLVELVLAIEHSTGGGTQEEFDLEVHATLILD